MSVGTGSILQLVLNNPVSLKPISYENTSLKFDKFSEEICIPHLADQVKPIFITSDKPIDYLLLKLNNSKIIKFPLDFCNLLSGDDIVINYNDYENINYIYKIPWSRLGLDNLPLIRMTKTKIIFQILSRHYCDANLYFQMTFLSGEDRSKLKGVFCKYYDILQFNYQIIKANCKQQLTYNGRSNGIFIKDHNVINSVTIQIDNNETIKMDKNLLTMSKKIGNYVYIPFKQSYLSRQISIIIDSNQNKIELICLNKNLLKSMGCFLYNYYPFDIYGLSLQTLTHDYNICKKNILTHNYCYSFDSCGTITIGTNDVIIIKPLYIVSDNKIEFLSFQLGPESITYFPLDFCNKITNYQCNKNLKNKYVYKLPWDMLSYNSIDLNKLVFIKIQFKIYSDHECKAKLYVSHTYNDTRDIHLQASTVYSDFSKRKPNKTINNYSVKNVVKNEIIKNSALNIIDMGLTPSVSLFSPISSSNPDTDYLVNGLISGIKKFSIQSPNHLYFHKHYFLQTQIHKAKLYDSNMTYIPLKFYGLAKGIFINNIDLNNILLFKLSLNKPNDIIEKVNLNLSKKNYKKINTDCYYIPFNDIPYEKIYEDLPKSNIDLSKLKDLVLIIKSEIIQNIEVIVLNFNCLLSNKGQTKLMHDYDVRIPNGEISFFQII